MPKKVSLPKTSSSARTYCGELQTFKTGTKGEILNICTDTALKFHECKAKHETLIKEYNALEHAVEEFNKN